MKTFVAITAVLFGCLMQSQAAGAKETWTKVCSKCHGKEGLGNTKMGKKLDIKDLTDAKAQASFTDEQAFDAIKHGIKAEGRTKMKPYGGELNDQEIKALVAYVRTLKKS